MTAPTLLALAVALDLALGDPPNRWHPVAWLGWLLAQGRRLAPAGPPWRLVVHGALVVALAAGAAAAAASWLDSRLEAWPIVRLTVGAWLLKSALSLRGLFAAVGRVRRRLGAGDLGGARRELGRHLVSRPTGDLDAGLVASAAVESLAENLTDSLVAPLAWYLVGGLPAAWAYRVVNTADAMLGYRAGDLEYLGKVAARLDDALNWLPARLAACALVAGAALGGRSARGAWRTMRRDGALTASPNAGRTMAAMAGALGVTLTKPGHYRLGDGPAPDTRAMGGAAAVCGWAAALVLAAALGLAAARG